MAVDTLSPGPNGDYPWFPRLPTGEPYWSDRAQDDGKPALGYNGGVGLVVVAPMPWGIRHVWRNGERVKVDMTPRDANLDPINPPVRLPG